VRGVGLDERHPFILRNTRLWNNFRAFRPGSPSVLVDGMDIDNGRYGLYRPVYDRHAYGRLTIAQVEKPQAFAQGETRRGFDVPELSGSGGRPMRSSSLRRQVTVPAKDAARRDAEVAKRPLPIRAGPGQPAMNPLGDEPQDTV
jgi:hypothetical protein